jgi:uncharacterized protein YciI
MDFLIYGRGVPGADDLRGPALDPALDPALLDAAHWSYMDAFAERMTARGPTLSKDRQTWTGSLHVVDLPNAEAARAFARNDPYHRAGLFTEHLIRHFDNQLGRTMWDFTLSGDDVPFLVIADTGNDGGSDSPQASPWAPALAERLVVWGTLRPEQAQRPSGVAVALVAPHRDAVRSLIAEHPAMAGGCADPQIHAWEFGGRR